MPPASFEATAVCAAPLNTRDRREERSSTQTTQTNVLVAHIGVLGHCTTWLGESVALPAINDGLGPLRSRPVLSRGNFLRNTPRATLEFRRSP